MSSKTSIKPIKVYGKGGPNPPKVAFMLEELGVPHEIIEIPFTDVKKPEYTAINPNGRLPSIYDPNTDLTLWESGAIVLYLVDQYDKERKLSFEPGTNEAYLAQQWLFYQTSGQGPYYGQAAWFIKFHPENVPSAVDRYIGEVKRVTGVLEDYLKKQDTGSDGPWLVGGRISYADISFLSWQMIVDSPFFGERFDGSEFPTVRAWVEKMKNRPGINKVREANEQMRH